MSVSGERFSMGGQGKRPAPREKIRGSQFVRREEKIRPKLRINPFEKWKSKLPVIKRPVA